MGRPSSFTQRIADAICERMVQGESLTRICRDDAMPSKPVVLKWLRDSTEFQTQYAHARDMLVDHYADDTIDIADTDEDPARARVRIDARKWYASKLAPKKYGDKVTTEVTGKDGEAVKFADVSDEHRARAMAFLVAKTSAQQAG